MQFQRSAHSFLTYAGSIEIIIVTERTDFEGQEYWAERDETGEYPHELHAKLAEAGWIGIALPEELGGAGLGISEATIMMQTIAQ